MGVEGQGWVGEGETTHKFDASSAKPLLTSCRDVLGCCVAVARAAHDVPRNRERTYAHLDRMMLVAFSQPDHSV